MLQSAPATQKKRDMYVTHQSRNIGQTGGFLLQMLSKLLQDVAFRLGHSFLDNGNVRSARDRRGLEDGCPFEEGATTLDSTSVFHDGEIEERDGE